MNLNPIVKKELISLFRRDHLKKGKQVADFLLSALFNFILVIFVVGLFTLFYTKSYKIISTNGVPAPFLVFVIFVAIVVGAYVLFTMNTFSNSLFNKNDRTILRVMPVKETAIILPKLGTTYLKLLATFGLMFLALLITFGVLAIYKPTSFIKINWWYWPMTIVFTFTVPFMIVFIGVVLSYPFHLLKGFIGRHPVIQIITSTVIITFCALVYFWIISTFAYLVKNDSLNAILRPSNCDFMKGIVDFLVPVNYIIYFLTVPNQKINILVYLAIFIVAVGSMYFIALGYYHRYLKVDDKFNVVKVKEPKLSKYPLIKKDFKLMFRNTSGKVSFIVLAFISAIFSTFLAYFVGVLFDSYGISKPEISKSFNGMYGELTMVSYLFFLLIVLFVTLSISVVFASETKLFIKEKITASVILTMPQTFKKQILSKMILNLVLLFSVNLLVFILIIGIGILAPVDALLLFIINLFVTFSTFLLTTAHTLGITKSLTATSDIATTGSYNHFISLVLPLMIFTIPALFIVICYFTDVLKAVPLYAIYILVVGLSSLTLSASIFIFISRLKKFSKFLSEGGVTK